MRIINFNAGPAGLPQSALIQARDELLDFEGSGMSVMEHSHRGAVYERVHGEVIERLTSLLAVPKSHTVVFGSGGATMQFGLLPMNFMKVGGSADFVVTGVWSEKAVEEAKCFGAARVAATTQAADGKYYRVPRADEVQVDPSASYLHSTSNNTVYGTQFHAPLNTGAVPHICDMSSDILSRPVDVSRYALIYGGAQKNIGPSGLVVIIANKGFLESARTDIPKVMRYATHAANQSLYNTPNTFAVYLARNVLRWIDGEGGLAGMARRNQAKADALYGALDALSGFYKAPVEKSSRSQMNIVFSTPSADLDARFVKEAEGAGMVGLKGHRTAGGIRVSAYNAASLQDIEALVAFLRDFAARHG